MLEPEFDALVDNLDEISFGRDAGAIYDKTFGLTKVERDSILLESDSAILERDLPPNNHYLARHAAFAIYPHVYARAAYTHAVALAARYPQVKRH